MCASTGKHLAPSLGELRRYCDEALETRGRYAMVAYVLIGLFALLIFLSISDVVIAVADWSPKKVLKPKGGIMDLYRSN